MKRMMMLFSAMLASLVVSADTWTDPATGIEWNCRVFENEIWVEPRTSTTRDVLPAATNIMGAVCVPSAIKGKSVTQIVNGSFYGCDQVTSVVIPGCVTWLDPGNLGVFYGCNRLVEFTIEGDSLYYFVQDGAIYSRRDIKNGVELSVIPQGLSSFCVAEGTKTIGQAACKGSGVIRTVSIPNTVRSIGAYAFQNCTNLIEFSIPSSIKEIGGRAFENTAYVTAQSDGFVVKDCCIIGHLGTENWELPKTIRIVDGDVLRTYPYSSLKLPDGLESIPHGMLFGSEFVADIHIPDSVQDIGSQAFDSSAIKSLFVPGSVQCVRSYALQNCLQLTNVVFAEGVEELEWGLFRSCHKLEDVTLPSSLRTISAHDSYGSFYQCDSLNIHLSGNNTNLVLRDGLLTENGRILHFVQKDVCKVSLPEGLTMIAGSALWNCTNITELTIPASVNSVGWYAFCGCFSLDSIDFEGAPPTGLSRSCISKDVRIRYNVAYETEWLPVISECGFSNAMPYMQPKEDGGPYAETKGGVEWTFEVANGMAEVVGVQKSVDGDLDIPQMIGGRSVVSIGANAFKGCAGLANVTIPDGVLRIGSDAFADMVHVGRISIPASVTSIGEGAFSQCSSLTNVTYLGDAPDTGDSIYEGTPRRLVSYVDNSSIGWAGGVSTDLPDSWNERAIQYFGNGDFAPTRIVWITNVVTEVRYETREETIFETNYVDVVVTNYVGVGDGDVGKVSDEVLAFEPSSGFDGSQKRTLNGIVFDDDGVFCGLAQIATAKATSRGVTVSGFVMLSDGKKQSLRSVRGAIEGGLLEIKTKVGKIGEIDLVIGANGFRGQIGDLTVVSANPDDESGVLKGSLLLYYFDPKTARLKTKSIKVSGVALEGDASGIIDVRGKEPKSFAAEIE